MEIEVSEKVYNEIQALKKMYFYKTDNDVLEMVLFDGED